MPSSSDEHRRYREERLRAERERRNKLADERRAKEERLAIVQQDILALRAVMLDLLSYGERLGKIEYRSTVRRLFRDGIPKGYYWKDGSQLYFTASVDIEGYGLAVNSQEAIMQPDYWKVREVERYDGELEAWSVKGDYDTSAIPSPSLAWSVELPHVKIRVESLSESLKRMFYATLDRAS